MININNAMKKLLSNEKREIETLKTKLLVKDIVRKTKLMKDCIIFDEQGELKEDKINVDKILKFAVDWTGYEISCNELRYSKFEIPPSQFLCFVEDLYMELSQKYVGKRFGIVLSLVDEAVELRFHTYRENEGLWLDRNLNRYENPILYHIGLAQLG